MFERVELRTNSGFRFTCIAAGVSHSIALTGMQRHAGVIINSCLEFGEVFTWGGKYSGQLGSSRPVDFTVPCKVEADGETLPSFKFVTAGDYCSAAISSTYHFLSSCFLALSFGANDYDVSGDS